MTVRFIHTADIHLDSPLSGLSSYADAPLDSLRNATRRAFEGLIDLALSEQVDFLVIAGDLFDGTWKDYNTGLFFLAQMGRLRKNKIRVALLYGNHDAESDLARTSRLRLPENVRVFDSSNAHSIEFEDLKVVLHGRSFWQRDVEENLVRNYPDPKLGWFNIGVLHTALSGREDHASYAPCSIEDLRARGYDYWALGHVHAAEVVSKSPLIVFPGSLQGRHIRETGAHGAYLVEVADGVVERLLRVSTDVVRWQNLAVDVGGALTEQVVLSRVEASLEQALLDSDGRPLAVRISLVGETRLHAEILGRIQHLRAEAQGLALAFGKEQIWIEKLRIQTKAPSDVPDQVTQGDALDDLRGLLGVAAADSELLRDLEKEFAELCLKLPHEVRRGEEPLLQKLREGDIAGIVEMVAPNVLSLVAER